MKKKQVLKLYPYLKTKLSIKIKIGLKKFIQELSYTPHRIFRFLKNKLKIGPQWIRGNLLGRTLNFHTIPGPVLVQHLKNKKRFIFIPNGFNNGMGGCFYKLAKFKKINTLYILEEFKIIEEYFYKKW